MKILFISTNRQTKVHRVAPAGVLYLASALIQRNHTIKLVDLMFSTDPSSDIVNAISEFNPDVTCISVRNVNKTTQDTNIIPDVDITVETVKKHSHSQIIIGGSGFSLLPEELMERLNPDFGIIGEADNSLPALINSLEHKSDYRRIPGLIHRDKKGTLAINPPGIVTDLDGIPFQSIELIDYYKYNKKAGYIGIFTRKGCPQKCIYCAEAQISGKNMRLRSPGRIVDEIEYIIDKTGITYFDFSDTLFNVPRKHAIDVCREIVRRNVKIQFEVELNPIGQDAEIVELLKVAGCNGLTLTADSGSDRMLQKLQKGYTANDILDAARLYAKFKIRYVICFLLGGPGENLESIEDSITLVESCPKMTAVLFGFSIRVFKNTRLSNMMIDQGLANKNDNYLNPKMYLADSFDDRCAERLLTACNERLNFFISEQAFCLNSKVIRFLSNSSNTRPPWKYIKFLGLILKIRNFGKSPLYWDSQARSFKCK